MRRYIFILVFLISSFWSFSQELELVYVERPLNEVLIELRDQYDVQLAFDDRGLSQYSITVNQHFSSMEDVFDFLLTGIPYSYRKSGDVFVIFPRIEEEKPEPIVLKSYRLSGQISDAETQESLPYAKVLINGHGQISDQKGNFSYVSNSDSLFHVQVSYLGYYMLDTLVNSGVNQEFHLFPSLFKIQEVEVSGKELVKNLQVGSTAGELRLNHKIAGYLPGNGDNSVFNLLRLQPGILAAGEQSNDLMIWGSYEGQSQVLFDGFTLFGMKNFNDNISAVNPFLAKDIQVMKGGYRAEYGERVGGVVNITSIDGSPEDVHVKMNINNMTMNGLVSIPVTDKSAVLLALRQTYYELYDPEQIAVNTKGRAGNMVDRNLFPDYNFRDLNLRYSGESKQGDSYSICFLTGSDSFSYSLEYGSQQANRLFEEKENNNQNGFSARYNKGWKNGGRSEFTLAYSDLQNETSRINLYGGRTSSGNGQGSGSGDSGGSTQPDINEFKRNTIAEVKLNLQNHLSVSDSHKLGFGFSYIYNQTLLRADTFDIQLFDNQSHAGRVGAYVEDHFSPVEQLELVAGLRTDYPVNVEKTYLQPRFSGTINLNDNFKLNGAWGLYNQYIAHSTTVDKLGNYRYAWMVSDDEGAPVLSSRHVVGGITFNKGNTSVSAEFFDKKTDGLTRTVEVQNSSNSFEGKSKSRGIDIFVKQDFRAHSFWVAYTLSQTLEHFSYFDTDEYQRALHDQRHELKLAALFQFNPFYFSANYVFGSGFPDPFIDDENDFERDYHRLDISAVYRFNMRKMDLEAGISILNVLNYENIKYDNFIHVPDDDNSTLSFHAEAVPFTPAMYLNISF